MFRLCEQAQTSENDWSPAAEEANVRCFPVGLLRLEKKFPGWLAKARVSTHF